MAEVREIIELSILHYQALLKLDRHTPETRQRLVDLLAKAQAELPAALSMGSQNDSQAINKDTK